MRDRLPLILSCTALIVAVFGATPLGEAAYKAVVPNNSVGPGQLRNAAVTNPKIRGDAVTSGKVLDGSLRAIDFKAGQLPAGAKGDKGDRGEKGERGEKGLKGDKGDKGVSGATTVVVRTKVVSKAAGTGTSLMAFEVKCAAGEQAIAGGAGLVSGGATSGVTLVSSVPVPNTEGAQPTAWKAGFSITNPNALQIGFYVVCAKP
jgi:hypothetical protein